MSSRQKEPSKEEISAKEFELNVDSGGEELSPRGVVRSKE